MAQGSLLTSIEVVVLEEPKRLLRLCGGSSKREIEASLRSNYETQKPPRGDERRAAVIHMALSMWDSEERARQLAARFERLGRHIAVLDLEPELGFCIADTAGAGHWSVWGDPLRLAGCVADVVDVGA